MKTSQAIEKLGSRSYASYLARLAAEKRLRRTGNLWNAAQFSLSAALVCSTVIFLTFPGSQAPLSAVILVILAILALLVSVIVAFLDYSARAQAMFVNYRRLQSFSVRVETLVDARIRISRRHLARLQAEYDSIMDTSENHQSIDHATAKTRGDISDMAVKHLIAVSAPVVLPALLMVVAGAIVTVSILIVA